MFKPGEVALVRADGRQVVVTTNLPEGQVQTEAGAFAEKALFVAHPSVQWPPLEKEPRSKKTDLDEIIDDLLSDRRRSSDASFIKLRTDRKTIERAVKTLKKAAFEWNGHLKNGKDWRKAVMSEFREHLFLGFKSLTLADAEALLQAAKKKQALDRWVPFKPFGFRTFVRACSTCGTKRLSLETNGKVIRITGEPCPFPDGLPLTEWELNVPSGRLVVANNLRNLFPLIDDDEDFNINTAFGCRQTALAFAEAGLAHAFVGNTCPEVYRCKDGSYKIANMPSNERWDPKKKEYVPVKRPAYDGVSLASICTDLWWFSICDHDEYLRRKARIEDRDRNIEVIDVEPGVYRFRHNEGAHARDYRKENVFTRFERVRPPDPVKDFQAAYEAIEVNPHAYVQKQVAQWPTLYGKYTGEVYEEVGVPWAEMSEADRTESWQKVADHIFCVIGGGTEWPEKGFPRARVDATIPDIDPPSFRAQHPWYPFSEDYSALLKTSLSPSFAKLAFRVLESIISFGMQVHDNAHSREVRYVRARMVQAVKRYRQLAALHPGVADPDYVAWLNEPGRAEAWVEAFDLGPEFTERHRERARKQRWLPDDTYAVEFDARKLEQGSFAWAPKNGGCWANKEDAQRYALLRWQDNEQPPEHNCFWTNHATNTSVPLTFVARVVKVGEVSHMGETLVELVFDYGTSWMIGPDRKALREKAEEAGIRPLTKAEYEQLLPVAREAFNTAD